MVTTDMLDVGGGRWIYYELAGVTGVAHREETTILSWCWLCTCVCGHVGSLVVCSQQAGSSR
jgi:hypothetical protein